MRSTVLARAVVRAGWVRRSRHLSDWSYVTAGAPLERVRHRVRWREDERYEVWESASIPFLARPNESVDAAVHAVAAAKAASGLTPPVGGGAPLPGGGAAFLVHLLRAVLTTTGHGAALADADWAAASAPEVTASEAAAVDTIADRRTAIMSLAAELQASVADADARMRDAVDGGEMDAALPLSTAARDSLSLTRNRPLLLTAIATARKLGVLLARVHATMTPSQREGISTGLAAELLQPRPSVASAIMAAAEKAGIQTTDDGEDADVEGNDEGAWARERATAFALRERTEDLPRAKLPPPLHADAPTPALADVATVLQDNPSLTPDDRRYIMALYADALAGKPAAFDWTAEKAAIVDPQPLWDAYDPEKVALQQRLRDAARGAGAHSPAAGVVHTAPAGAVVGEVEVGAGAVKMTASAEADAAAAAAAAATRARVASASATVAKLLEATLGTSVTRKMPAPSSGATDPAQIAAARAKITGSVGADVAALLKNAAAAPAGLSKGAAGAVAASFFKQYAAGTRPAPPAPPAPGVKRPDPIEPALAPAPKAGGAAAGKGGKGGKGGKAAAPAPAAGGKKK